MKKKLTIYGVNYFPAKGGTSTVVENLILQLKDKYDITIYCYRNPAAEAWIPGVRVVQFRQLAPGSAGSLIYFFLSALHILLFGRADLISAHKTDCAIFIPLLRLRFPVIASSHEAPYKRDKWNGIQKAYFKLSERVFIHSASVCTCISDPLTRYYQQKYRRAVHFIPNGINRIGKTDFDYRSAASFLPAGSTLSQPFILFSARRLMATKGCHTMLEALRLLNYQGQVFISGELQSSAYLRKLRELSEGLNVSFLGYVKPLSALLALVEACRFFVFPSETEGMSVMLLEAASTGRPVIASDIPENRQVFTEDEVLYFRSGDAADLAEKLLLALSDPRRIEMKGLKAREKVFTEYLWYSIALKYDRLFQKVINKPNVKLFKRMV